MKDGMVKGPTAKAAFILVIVSFALSTVISLASLHLMNQQSQRDMNHALATQIYDYLNAELSGPITAARTMSFDSFLAEELEDGQALGEEALAADLQKYLTRVEEGLGYNLAFVISDSSKRYYTRKGYNRTVDTRAAGRDAWYASFVGSDEDYELDVDNVNSNRNELAVFVNAKIKDEKGALLGVCGVGLKMSGIQELFRTFESSFNVKIDLINSEGIVQVDTNDESIESANMSELIAGKKSGEYIYEEADGGFSVTKYMGNIDWFLVVRDDGSHEVGKYASIIALNAILCSIVLAVFFVALRIIARRATALEAETVVDHATGLFNKRAYLHDRKRREAMPLDADFAFLTADLNGLKTVNDTRGHEAGDALIKGAADCLQSCFGAYGKLYRIGGDEFAGLLHIPLDGLDALRQRLDQLAGEWADEHSCELSISCGFATAAEFPHATIEVLALVSDERMYEDKDRYYERTGAARR